jgi:hypothetical protein
MPVSNTPLKINSPNAVVLDPAAAQKLCRNRRGQ